MSLKPPPTNDQLFEDLYNCLELWFPRTSKKSIVDAIALGGQDSYQAVVVKARPDIWALAQEWMVKHKVDVINMISAGAHIGYLYCGREVTPFWALYYSNRDMSCAPVGMPNVTFPLDNTTVVILNIAKKSVIMSKLRYNGFAVERPNGALPVPKKTERKRHKLTDTQRITTRRGGRGRVNVDKPTRRERSRIRLAAARTRQETKEIQFLDKLCQRKKLGIFVVAPQIQTFVVDKVIKAAGRTFATHRNYAFVLPSFVEKGDIIRTS